MTTSIIITLCVLILIAYAFDISAPKTKIPSVILLLLLGVGVKFATSSLSVNIPDLNPILPILGTMGLILIVLEGSLELEINSSKLPLIAKSSFVALLPILVISFSIACYLFYSHQVNFKIALANAIPLGIISSAIAIPSARNLLKPEQEFITYESSLSDIFGVILFNFITLNDNIGTQTVGLFVLQLIAMLVISFAATLLLTVFLHKINHHIKFIPILLLVILIYAISKEFHLPALLFILIFGLFLGNIDELKHIKTFRNFDPANFGKEVHKFKEITTEMAFLVRALFFILFGFLIDMRDLLNTQTILPALGITCGIFIIRYLVLKIARVKVNPMVFIAPRGLITILLFLSIPLSQQIPFIDKALITQIIILSALGMMAGLLRYKKPIQLNTEEEEANHYV